LRNVKNNVASGELMHLLEVVLGDLIFDRVNELQITKFHLGWNVDSNTFPTSYPAPNLDTGKASKSHLEVSLRISLGALRTQGALRINTLFSV